MSFNEIEGDLNKRKKGIEFEKGLADLFAQLKKLESLVGACRATNLEGSRLDEASLQPIMETHVSVEFVLSALETYHCPGLPYKCPRAVPGAVLCPFGKRFSMLSCRCLSAFCCANGTRLDRCIVTF